MINKSLLSDSVSTHLAIALALCKLLQLETYLAGTIACMMTHYSSSLSVLGVQAEVDVSTLLQLGSEGVSNERLRGVPGEAVQVLNS